MVFPGAGGEREVIPDEKNQDKGQMTTLEESSNVPRAMLYKVLTEFLSRNPEMLNGDSSDSKGILYFVLENLQVTIKENFHLKYQIEVLRQFDILKATIADWTPDLTTSKVVELIKKKKEVVQGLAEKTDGIFAKADKILNRLVASSKTIEGTSCIFSALAEDNHYCSNCKVKEETSPSSSRSTSPLPDRLLLHKELSPRKRMKLDPPRSQQEDLSKHQEEEEKKLPDLETQPSK